VAVTAPISPYVRTLLREKYFAARPDTYLGEEVWSKFENLSKRPHPMGDLWEASYAHYYGDESWSGRTWGMSRRGDQGQIAAIRINRARRNSKARQALILAGMVRAKARAANRDAKSAYAVQLAELMLEYDYKKGGIDSFWAQWVEQTEVFADSYAFTRWVPWKGDVVGIENGRPVYNGDLETTLHAPWLVEFDESYPVADQSPWHYVRTYEPKQDLVLNYTSLLDGRTGDRCADAIWGARGDARLERLSRVAAAEHNTACVVNFIHYPSPVLPLGLFMRQLDADIVLERRPLIGDNGDYDETCPRPLIRMAADEMTDTPHAWAPFWNVLAAQELSDALLTSHATTVTTYNDPIYAVTEGSANKPDKLASGPGRVWNVISGGVAPTLIERPVVTESAMQFDERIAAEMEQDMALNDAVFGRQEGATKNAQADALQASQAVQQVAPAARSARVALGKLYELRLKTLRKNAKGARLLRIVGKSRQSLLLDAATFNADELSPFEGVEIEDENPLAASAQGRWAIVELFQKLGIIKTVENAESVMSTGRLEPVVDPVREENLLIMSENDAIRRGETPPVYVTDNDVLHMRQHMVPTMSPGARNDPSLLQAWQQHNDAHYAQKFGLPPGTPATADPLYHQRWAFIMGLAPEPPPPMMAPGPVPAPGSKPNGPPAPNPSMAPVGPTDMKPPKNPLTNQPFSNTAPPLGGGPS
jgi:hypothetical protein